MTVRTIISRGLVSGALATLLTACALMPGPAPSVRTSPPVLTPPPAATPAETGRFIAERDCSGCHAIGRDGESPLEGAPRWRDLHTRFDVADLGEALAEGITVGHEAMPANPYDPADVQALIAYLKSLEAPGDASPKR